MKQYTTIISILSIGIILLPATAMGIVDDVSLAPRISIKQEKPPTDWWRGRTRSSVKIKSADDTQGILLSTSPIIPVKEHLVPVPEMLIREAMGVAKKISQKQQEVKALPTTLNTPDIITLSNHPVISRVEREIAESEDILSDIIHDAAEKVRLANFKADAAKIAAKEMKEADEAIVREKRTIFLNEARMRAALRLTNAKVRSLRAKADLEIAMIKRNAVEDAEIRAIEAEAERMKMAVKEAERAIAARKALAKASIEEAIKLEQRKEARAKAMASKLSEAEAELSEWKHRKSTGEGRW